MYKVLINILFLFFVLLSSVYAGKNTSMPKSKVIEIEIDKSGIYIGISTGWVQLNNEYTRESFDAIPMLMQVGYRFNQYLAVEARYFRDAGKVKYNGGNTQNLDNNDFPTQFSNYGFYLKPTYPVEDFNFYLLLGYGEVSLNDVKGADRYENGFQWGLGLGYDIDKHIKLFVDYSTLYNDLGFAGRAKLRNVHVDMIGTGVTYAF